jgi:site-specific recombinase XerD
MTEKRQLPPTQNLIDIKDIKDGIVYLKNGEICQVLMVGGINFDLKSEEEQNAIIGAFQKFLNMLDFKTQFFIHSRKVNVENYLKTLEERKKNETNELLKVQIDEYINFIRSFVEENSIITKKFFVVISYFLSSIPQNVKSTSSFFNFFKKTNENSSRQLEESIEKSEAIHQLRIRVETVISGLEQIGLKAFPLEDDELIELFYNLYNPQLIEGGKRI